jgi:hypothetical protein
MKVDAVVNLIRQKLTEYSRLVLLTSGKSDKIVCLSPVLEGYEE